MTKRTTVNLDTEMLERAREILGAKTVTETVNKALEEVTRVAAIKRLAEWEFRWLTPERLREIRKGRVFDEESVPADVKAA